jgi:hypothetical protein
VVVADLSALQPRPAPCGGNPLAKHQAIRISTMKPCKSMVSPQAGKEAIESLREFHFKDWGGTLRLIFRLCKNLYNFFTAPLLIYTPF